MLRLVCKNRFNGAFCGRQTIENGRMIRSSSQLSTSQSPNDADNESSPPAATSSALTKLTEPNRMLPQKYEYPNQQAIIEQSRKEVQAQIAAGGKPRLPYRLWKMIFSKANDYTFEQYNLLAPGERIVHGKHWRAMQDRKLTYTDPFTRREVMTMAALYLQGQCCGNGCRHCPYEHVNVPLELKMKKKWNGAYYV